MGTTPSQLDCIQPAPPYILKTRTPLYDLIIVDCLYPVLSPYINITVPDLKSVSTTGTVGLLGTDFASVLWKQFTESEFLFRYAIKCLELSLIKITFSVICYYFRNPCCAMLCYVMICYTMLCYSMLYYTILYYTTLCSSMLSWSVLCYAILSYTILCYAMLHHAMLYYALLYYPAVICPLL